MKNLERSIFDIIFDGKRGSRLWSRPCIRDDDVEVLSALINKMHLKNIVEFGVHEGNTASRILERCPIIQRYIGIDVSSEYKTLCDYQNQQDERPSRPAMVNNNAQKFNFIVKKNGSHDMTISDFENIDMVFIDGDHSYEGCKQDTLLSRQIVKKGIIAWHDYNWSGEVHRLLNEECILHPRMINLISEFGEEYSDGDMGMTFEIIGETS